jgi:putative membrane fusion protein
MERKRMTRKKTKEIGVAKKLLGIGVLVLLLLGSLGWVYRSSILTGSLKVELAKQGSIEHIQTVSAVFANEEVPIKAPAAGKPEFIGQEGQRFRRGDQVAVMRPEGVDLAQKDPKAGVPVLAPIGGILSYGADGLESVLSPDNLLTMDLSKVLEQSAFAKDGEGVVQNGGLIGKITNNLRPTVAVIKIAPTEENKLGKTLKFTINGYGYSAKVVRLLEYPPGLVVQFNQYVEGTAKQRLQEISWISRPAVEGVILPKSTLWNKGEEQGVYVVQGGVIQFRKVKILDENEKEVCIEGLPHGIPVIINPRSGLDSLTMNV